MPSQKNITAVADLQERVGRAKSMVFAKYTGMTVPQQQNLRKAIREAGGEVLVAKNRLLKIALGKPEGSDKLMEDQLLTVFSYEDEVSAVKAVTAFIKDNEFPEIKGGFFENTLLDVAGVKRLSLIPGRNELVAQLLQRLQSPGAGLRNVVEAVPRNLVSVLQAIVRKNESAS